MKVLILVTLVEILFVFCEGSNGRGRNLYISEEDQDMIIMYHNDVRRNETGHSGFQELKWDPEIAEFAKDWGKQCIYKRPFDDPYVENLFYKRYRKRDKPKEIMMDAIGAWLKRPDVVHNRGRRGCRRSETCKYVQISTRDTESVGCTVTECPFLHFRNSKRKSMYYVVCFYKPTKAFAEKEKLHRRKGKCPVCPSGYHCKRSRCVRVRKTDSEHIPTPANPFAKYRRHPVTRRIEAPSADIVVRNDVPRHGRQDTRLEVRGLPEKNIRYNRNHPAPQNQILGRRAGYLSSSELRSITDAHNNLRRIQGLAGLTWDAKLQKWANYVIRCDIEYPGPITDYTNFGKADSRRDLTSVVNNWGSEGNDVFQRLSNGCRTPYDRSQCNHYTIMMNPQIDRIGCASLNCGSRRQLTCIYRDTQARPFRRGPQRG